MILCNRVQSLVEYLAGVVYLTAPPIAVSTEGVGITSELVAALLAGNRVPFDHLVLHASEPPDNALLDAARIAAAKQVRVHLISASLPDRVLSSQQLADAGIVRRTSFAPLSQRPAGNSVRACSVLWRGPLYIDALGTVHPCRHIDDRPIGNLFHDSWRRIWNHPTMIELRRVHAENKGDLPEPCRCCVERSHKPAQTFGDFLLP